MIFHNNEAVKSFLSILEPIFFLIQELRNLIGRPQTTGIRLYPDSNRRLQVRNSMHIAILLQVKTEPMDVDSPVDFRETTPDLGTDTSNGVKRSLRQRLRRAEGEKEATGSVSALDDSSNLPLHPQNDSFIRLENPADNTSSDEQSPPDLLAESYSEHMSDSKPDTNAPSGERNRSSAVCSSENAAQNDDRGEILESTLSPSALIVEDNDLETTVEQDLETNGQSGQESKLTVASKDDKLRYGGRGGINRFPFEEYGMRLVISDTGAKQVSYSAVYKLKFIDIKI